MNKRSILLRLIDVACFAAVYAVALIISLFSDIGYPESLGGIFLNACILVASIMVCRELFRIYFNVWRYATTAVYLKMIASDICGGISGTLLSVLFKTGVSPTINMIVILGGIILTLASRLVYSYMYDVSKKRSKNQKINVAIVGAGKIGVLLANELTFNKNSHYYPFCFIDSDSCKAGNYVSGIKVYAEDDGIIEKIKRMPVQEIFIALPRLGGDELKKVYDFYSQTGCKIKIYDLPIADLNTQTDGPRQLREFRIEDLLFRNTMQLNNDHSREYYAGKTVLVTGGGGSIGSELCRQIAKCNPKKLVIFDIYENNAYDIQQELVRKYGDSLDLSVEIGSVRDVKRLDCVFAAYRPDVVFHAAAHKHVPLMEHSGCEAIKNNVLGTFNAANAAEKFGVHKFILVSTDKAVNPTNIMGASKRMCEMVIQCRTDSPTSFAAVRFGNVLGSNGSVIPLFRHQIENGGPVTITDKRIIRYFMTIPEASQLVMEAGAMAQNGELFVLNMGNPVKILDLAENMIKLSGYEPYKDIDIVEVGLRPGEKLYEELLMKNEKLMQTSNNKIYIEHDKPLTRAQVDEKIRILTEAVQASSDSINTDKIKLAMRKAVPTYHDPDEVNALAVDSNEMKLAGVV